LPASELENFVRSKAQALAALPSDAVRTTKRLMKAAQASSVDVVMQEELLEFTRLLSGPDAKEAFEAFIQKRKPQFT
jgi:enoyl-CoA hydratase/carnithine racemase